MAGNTGSTNHDTGTLKSGTEDTRARRGHATFPVLAQTKTGGLCARLRFRAFWAEMPSVNRDGYVTARLYLLPSVPDGKDGRELRGTFLAAALDRLEKHGAKRLREPIPTD